MLRKLVIASRAYFFLPHSIDFQLLKLWYCILNSFFISTTPSTSLSFLPSLFVFFFFHLPPLCHLPFFFFVVKWFISSFIILVFCGFFLWHSLEVFRDSFGHYQGKEGDTLRFHRSSREPCDGDKLWPSIFLKIERF